MMRMKRENGFSLIELMIAIMLLTIGLLALVSMEGMAIRSDRIANRLSTGMSLAQEASEQLMSLPKKDPILNANSAPNTTYRIISMTGAGDYGIYYTITTSATGWTSIDVVVKYDPNGVAQQVAELTTGKSVI
jgi:prepilin-type N-terminal cleavage/methylation domain-containing protein